MQTHRLASRVLSYRAGSRNVKQLAWSSRESRLAVADENGSITLYDHDKADFQRVSADNKMLIPLEWSPDGVFLGAGESGGDMLLLNLSQGGMPQRLPSSKSGYGVNCFAWFPDGKKVLVCDHGTSCKIWGTDGRLDRKLTGVDTTIGQLVLSPDAKRTAAIHSAAIGHISVHDMEADQPGATLKGNFGSIRWRNDGLIAAIGFDHVVRFWNPQANKIVKEVRGPGPGQFTHDGIHVAEQMVGATRIWNVDNGRPGHTYLPFLKKTDFLAIAPDGHYHGSPDVEKLLVYVVRKADGTQETLSPAEFEQRYGWKNDPFRATRRE